MFYILNVFISWMKCELLTYELIGIFWIALQLEDLLIVFLFIISNFVDSRGRLVAGSFQGYTGHVDGKPNEARFNHPKGVTMDDKGNLYVADTLNLAIRKIGDAGMFNSYQKLGWKFVLASVKLEQQ